MGIDPNLSYYTFWDSLRAKFLRDAGTTYRQNWRSVRLQITGEKLSLQDWERFQAHYISRRDLVDDWTDAEDQSYVFASIPSYYQSRVLGETGKRRQGKLWVRVGIPPGRTQNEVLQFLEQALAFPLRVRTSERRHFVVICNDQQEVNNLLEWDSADLIINGQKQTLSVTMVRYAMSGDELFAFVRRLLEEEDELRLLQRAYGVVGGTPTPRATTKAVYDQSPAPEKKKANQGKSGSPFRRPPRGNGKKNEKKKDDPGKGKNPRQVESPAKKSASVDSGGKSDQGKGKGATAKGICYTCRDGDRPAEHDYKTCPHLLAKQKKKEERAKKEGSSNSQSTGHRSD